jgi:hypothetical protein
MRINHNEPTPALRRIPVYLETPTLVPITGAVPVGVQLQVSLSGAAWTNGLGTWVEDANGVYYYQATQAETFTDSFLMLRVAVPGAKIVVFHVDIGIRTSINEPLATARRYPIYLVNTASIPQIELPITGAEAQLSKNGAAFVDCAGVVAEIGGSGNGLGAYYYEATLAEVNTLGYDLLKINKTPTALLYIYEWNVVFPSQSLTYRMRAFDVTLARTVFWPSLVIDTSGTDYIGVFGPGPLIRVVVQDIIGQAVTTIVPGVEAMPEMWAQENVAASQTNVALSCLVSTNFDTIKMIRAGSIVGLGTRLTQAITAGTLTVVITKNGVAGTLSIAHTSGTGSAATQAVGIDTYVAGDLIGIEITTTSGFLPNTTYFEAWLEVLEAP